MWVPRGRGRPRQAGVVQAVQSGRLVALGDEPLWSGWAEWARDAGIPFSRCPWVPGVSLASTAPAALAADQPTVVLVPAGPNPGGHVVAQALIDMGPLQADAWLVLTRPTPDQQASVLVAGGAGCLPSPPDGAAIARALALAAWRPPLPPATEPAAASAGRPCPSSPGPPAPQRGRDAWGAPARPADDPRGPRAPSPWSFGPRSRPRQVDPPWWAWPGPSVRDWAVLVPDPAPSEWAAATLGAWRAARGRPNSGLMLGSVARPRRMGPDAPLYVAAAQEAAAVVCPVGRVGHRAVRDVVAALRALGAPEIRAWVVWEDGRAAPPLWEWALGVPSARVSLGSLRWGPALGVDPAPDVGRAAGAEAGSAGAGHGRTG